MKRYIIIFFVAFLVFLNREASAFWWKDSADAVSGLDVAAGFDVNTITTVVGTVTTMPERKGQEQHAVMGVAATQGSVTVILGPWSYWEKQTIVITKGQEFTITGSLAQGKDGALYLFAQRLENRITVETVTLRSESGKPVWSGTGSRYGPGNRGSGMRGGRR